MVFLECLAWVPIVLCNLIRDIGICVPEKPLVLILQEDDVVNDLPDECLIEVLTRLSSYDIFTCRRVCKRWHIFTSSNVFIESQTKRAPTIIFGDVFGTFYGHKYFTLADEKGNMKLKELQLNKIGTKFTKSSMVLLYSFGGLLLFWDPSHVFIVLNTISRKEAIVRRPQNNDGEDLRGRMCGLFFHPLGCEYKLLYVHIGQDNISCWYYVYGSASNSWRNINATPLHFRPARMCAPVVVDMGLHWIVDSGDTMTPTVMVFKIDSEEICTFPLHELVGNDDCDTSMMTLLEIDKQLCFGHQITCKTINLWVLDDYENRRWLEMPSLRFRCPMPTGPSRNGFTPESVSRNKLRILYVCPDMLLISWRASAPYLLDRARNTLYKMYDPPHICSATENETTYRYYTYTCSLKIPAI